MDADVITGSVALLERLAEDELPSEYEYLPEPRDLNSKLLHIARTAQVIFSADLCTIFAVNPITRQYLLPSTQRPIPVHAGELLQKEDLGFRRPGSGGITEQILDKSMLIVEDIPDDSPYVSRFTIQQEIKGFAAIALKTRRLNKPLAVLYIDFRQPHTFTQEERYLLGVLAKEASRLLESTWLLRRYREISRIGQEINQELNDVETLFNSLITHLGGILDTSCDFMLGLYHPETDLLDFYIVEDEKPVTLMAQPCVGGSRWVIHEEECVKIDTYTEDEKAGKLPTDFITLPDTKPDIESVIMVRLTLLGKPLGVLSLQHSKPNVYDHVDLQLMQLLGNHVALALNGIRNLRLLADLDEISEAGRFLSHELNAGNLLEEITERILNITRADVVVLYPYERAADRFLLPAHLAGQLLEPDFQQPPASRKDDLASLTVRSSSPIFAHYSHKLYELLGGDPSIRQGNFAEREKVVSSAAVPLLAEGEPVGALFINYRRLQHFDEPQQYVIRVLSNYAAIAIKNSREFLSVTERQLHELQSLQEITRHISKTLDLNHVLQSILEWVRTDIKPNRASILLLNERTNSLETQAAIGEDSEERLKQVLSLDEETGLTVYAFHERESMCVGNVRAPEWAGIYTAATGSTISELDVLLFDENEKPIGVINCESDTPNAFTPVDQSFLEALAAQVVAAIMNARLYESAEAAKDRLLALRNVDKKIIEQLSDPDEVIWRILDSALTLIRAEKGDLHLYEGNQPVVSYFARKEPGEPFLSEGKIDIGSPRFPLIKRGIVAHVATTRKTYWTRGDAREDPLFVGDEDDDVKSELAVPLLSNPETLIGVLNVESRESLAFNEDQESVLSMLADQAVIAIHNANSYARANLLLEIGKNLAPVADRKQLEAAYELVTSRVRQHTKAQVAIREFYRDEEVLALIGGKGKHLRQPEPMAERVGLNKGVNGQVAALCWPTRTSECKTIIVNDINNLPPGVNTPKPSSKSIQSFVVTPILFEDQYYGNLTLSHENTNFFRDVDVELIEGVAQRIAITFHRLEVAQLHSEAVQRIREAEIMSSIGQQAIHLPHRLGNGLGWIRSYVERIRRELAISQVGNPSIEGWLNRILNALQPIIEWNKKMKEQIGQLSSGERRLRTPHSIPVQELLEDAERLIPDTQLANVQLIVEIAPNVVPVFADRSDVESILRELISNATEAMPDGGTITLRARNTGQYIEIDVIDTGPGIPLAMQGDIFNLFFSTKGTSGFGFGLYSAKREALANGGDLRVKSDPERRKGTTFTLVLPRADTQTGGKS